MTVILNYIFCYSYKIFKYNRFYEIPNNFIVLSLELILKNKCILELFSINKSGTPCGINTVSRTQINPVMKKPRTQFDPENDFRTQLGTAGIIYIHEFEFHPIIIALMNLL